MKKLFFSIVICLSVLNLSKGQTDQLTTFILVRHAEKAKDDLRDPNLSKIGLERAQRLKTLLTQADITAIYSTAYRRTQQTVAPIAEEYRLEIKNYDPRSMDFLKEILNTYSGGTILISGHSNTTPVVVNTLLGKEAFQMLNEYEYDKIFVVTTQTLGRGKVTTLRY